MRVAWMPSHTGSIHFLCRKRGISSSGRCSMASWVRSVRACLSAFICLLVLACSSQSLRICLSFVRVSGSMSLPFALASVVMVFLSKALSFSLSRYRYASSGVRASRSSSSSPLISSTRVCRRPMASSSAWNFSRCTSSKGRMRPFIPSGTSSSSSPFFCNL